MKKTLVAIAALAAATGAMAQSSVEIYGIMDIGYNKITAKSDTNTITQSTIGAGGNSANGSGNLNGSRVGFRGTEDLGSGNKAGFVFEYGVNLTGAGTATTTSNGNTTLADNAVGQGLANLRQGFVSLSSDSLGTVRAGTQYAYHDATSGAIAGDSASGGTNNVVGAANLLKYGYTGAQPRLTGAVSYTSPTFSGVTLKAMYNTGKATNDSSVTGANVASNANNAKSYAIDYVNGPLKAGFAQTQYTNVGAIASTAGLTMLADVLGTGADQVGATALTAGTLLNITNRVAGAQYDAGFAKFGLNHGTYSADYVASSTNDIYSSQTMATAAVPVLAKTTLLVGYTTGEIDQAGTKQFNTKAYDFIVKYDLSKRTNVYGLFVQTKYNAQTTSVANTQQYQYGVGVRHSF